MSLSTQYRILTKELPDLYDHTIEQAINGFGTWLHTADDDLDVECLPNTVLAPLVVISQLVQYRLYSNSENNDQQSIRGVAGFCMGLLSALAISISHRSTIAEFESNTGAAVCLAMLVGAVVDRQHLQDARGTSRTLSIAWKRADSIEKSRDLEDILRNFPEVSLGVIIVEQY